MYILTQFGTTSLPIGSPKHTAGTAGSEKQLIKLIGGGVYDAGGDQAAAEYPYELTYECKTVGASASDLRTQLDALRALRGVSGRLYRKRLDDPLVVQWTTARLMQVPYDTDARHSHGLYQPIRLVWLVFDGWHGTIHGAGWTFDSGQYLDSGQYFDMGDSYTTLSSTSNTLTIVNNGNTAVEDVVLTITAALTPITKVTIAVGSCDLVFSDTIAAGQSLVIDCGNCSVYNNGAAAWNKLGFGANHASNAWCRLERGANTMTVTRTGGGPNSSISVEFSDGWE